MKIALMDKRIELLEPETAEDGFGGFTTLWRPRGRVWARVMNASFAGGRAFETPVSAEELRLKIRPRKDVKRGWLVRMPDGDGTVLDTDNTYRDSTVIIAVRREQGE